MTHINASNVRIPCTKVDRCPSIYCLNHVSYASYVPELSQSNMHILIKDKVEELKNTWPTVQRFHNGKQTTYWHSYQFRNLQYY